ncbi:MAG: fibronectin type III domain-containing protein, partial [Acidobacteria bacterium]|nr:fibronectin type III domain-containing protein [Acidobacteriota bacterium]
TGMVPGSGTIAGRPPGRARPAAALGAAALAVAALLPAPGAAQPVALAGLTCTTSDELNVAVTKGDRELSVTWDAVAGVTQYNVTWSPASGDGTTSAQVAGTAYTITGLSNIVEYTVAVEADTTLTCSATVPTNFPVCPTDALEPTATSGDGRLTVDWGPVTGATSYELAWSPAATDGRRAAEVSALSYVIASLRNGVAYTIVVGAGPDEACRLTGTPAGPSSESTDSSGSSGGSGGSGGSGRRGESGEGGDADGRGGDGQGGDGEDDPVQVPTLPFGGLVALAAALAGAARRARARQESAARNVRCSVWRPRRLPECPSGRPTGGRRW